MSFKIFIFTFLSCAILLQCALRGGGGHAGGGHIGGGHIGGGHGGWGGRGNWGGIGAGYWGGLGSYWGGIGLGYPYVGSYWPYSTAIGYPYASTVATIPSVANTVSYAAPSYSSSALTQTSGKGQAQNQNTVVPSVTPAAQNQVTPAAQSQSVSAILKK